MTIVAYAVVHGVDLPLTEVLYKPRGDALEIFDEKLRKSRSVIFLGCAGLVAYYVTDQ